MKIIKAFAAFAAASMVFACAPKANVPEEGAQEAAPVSEKNIKDLIPSKGQIDSVSYLIGINFGYFIKMNNFGEDLNYAQIKRGMMDFINSKGSMQDPDFNNQFKVSPEEMNTLFSSFIAKRQEYKAEKNRLDGEKFLAKNKTKDGVLVTETGLQYRIIAEGEGEKIAANDTVSVYYTGTFIDGEEFDARKEEEGTDPFEFTVKSGYGGVIAGWVEGLQLASKGSELELFVPSELAYGKNSYNMEPNKTLIFKIKVVDVKKYVEPVVEETAE